MASPHDLARLLLSKARDDKFAMDVLIENPKVADEIIGFHAQQIIEKAIKSILSLNSIRYRKSHDLAELIDLLRDNEISVPPSWKKLQILRLLQLSSDTIFFRLRLMNQKGSIDSI